MQNAHLLCLLPLSRMRRCCLMRIYCVMDEPFDVTFTAPRNRAAEPDPQRSVQHCQRRDRAPVEGRERLPAALRDDCADGAIRQRQDHAAGAPPDTAPDAPPPSPPSPPPPPHTTRPPSLRRRAGAAKPPGLPAQDILSGRKTTGTTEGVISFSGSQPSRAFLRRFTGYVEQFDTLLGTLTVREMLLYTAELKRPRQEAFVSKAEAVDELMGKLALGSCRDVKIGSKDNKGISGGQAKRVNIGIALITNPRVLVLDEPTSGLDSYTANEVMTVVKEFVKDQVTVVATIHSPTQYAFSLFSNLMMLVRGQVVYFGRQQAEAMAYASQTWCGAAPRSPGRGLPSQAHSQEGRRGGAGADAARRRAGT